MSETERKDYGSLLQSMDQAEEDPQEPIDRDKIAEVSAKAGFPPRQAPTPLKKKQKARKPNSESESRTEPVNNTTDANEPEDSADPANERSAELSEEAIAERISSRKPGRRSEGPKVQFNTRISNRSFVTIDDLREETGMPFGKLVERGIVLLAEEIAAQAKK